MESIHLQLDETAARSEAGYDCIKEIARGGYGQVFLLRKAGSTSEYIAGKFVHRHVFGSPTDPSSLAAYRRALEGLQNFCSLSRESPYLLRVFEVRQRHESGYFCYMMELADDMSAGDAIDSEHYRPRTLKNAMDEAGHRERIPSVECVRIALALAHGLQILHESGFTHRDVRPSNIIFVNDVPKLADIDLLAGNDTTLASFIPRDYATPEGAHSPQADIFSLGKTLYEMCTGLPVKAFPCLPPDIRHWKDHRLFLELNRIVARACAWKPKGRYRSAEELVDALQNLEGSSP